MEFLKGIQFKVHLDTVIIKMYVRVGSNIEEILKNPNMNRKIQQRETGFPFLVEEKKSKNVKKN